MSNNMKLDRSELDMKMLAAWLNVSVDQIPPENKAHHNPVTMEAWRRVGEAAIRHASETTRHQPQEREAVLDEANIERVARAMDPPLWADHVETAHMAASPLQVCYARERSLERARLFLTEYAILTTTPAPAEGDDLTDEQWNKVLEYAPKPDGPLTPITPAVSTDEIVAVAKALAENHLLVSDGHYTAAAEAILSRLRGKTDD